jgi:hypothetical protein
MNRVIRRFSTTAYALGVLGALTFGASQALGRAVQQTCPYDPPTFLGACVQPGWEKTCDSSCDSITGDPDSWGRCDTPGHPGCCVCLMR